MELLYRLTIQFTPAPWQRAGRNIKQRRTFDTARNRETKHALQWAAKANRIQRIPAPDPIVLRVCVVLPAPSTGRPWPTAQCDGDWDNYAKVFCDAWGKPKGQKTGLVFDNDSQLIACLTSKQFAQDGGGPRWYVEIWRPHPVHDRDAINRIRFEVNHE